MKGLETRLRELERSIRIDELCLTMPDGSTRIIRTRDVLKLLERAIQERNAGPLSDDMRAIAGCVSISESTGGRLGELIRALLIGPAGTEDLDAAE